MAGSETKEWKFLGLNMWQQVVLALILGVLTGYIWGEQVEGFKILGTIFFKFIKMVVSPLIFFALIAGITSLTEASHFKGLAIKGVAGYLLTSMFAVVIGLTFGFVFEPGAGMLLPEGLQPVAGVGTTEVASVKGFIYQLIPGNIVKVMANDMYLQVVVFAVFTGIVMNNISGETAMVKELNQEMAHIIFKMIEWIVRLAPLAVFGFMAATVGTTGFDVLASLLKLVFVVLGACLFQYVVFLLMIMFLGRMSPVPFMKKMFTTQIFAFSTSSSKATLTTAMRELQDKMGVSQSSCNFMMPLGACINMDGTAIYLGICATFFAQIYGVSLDLQDYLVLMLTSTLGAIGAAGIPSGSIIFMGMVLGSVGIPMEGIAVILGVDRILDMFRTTVNVTGDSAITLIVDRSEDEVDMDVYYDKK